MNDTRGLIEEKVNNNVLETNINSTISKTLKIPYEMVNNELKYQSIKEWDSLAHIQLIIELEEKFNLIVNDSLMEELTSVSGIKNVIYEHYDLHRDLNSSSNPVKGYINRISEDNINKANNKIYRGLNNLNFDKTEITNINGKTGTLQYRGYNIDDLVENASYEEVSFLLVFGQLPDKKQYENYKDTLVNSRIITQDMIDIIYKLRNSHPMDMLRTVISYLSSQSLINDNKSNNETIKNGIKLIAQIPIIVSIFHLMRKNRDYVEPNQNFYHAKNFLYMLKGEEPSDELVSYIEKGLILQADHGSNASTFTARVVTSTQADIYASITSAVAAFSGPLHGGAAENVMKMIEEIGTVENVPSYIQELMMKNEPVMGFGHRIYRVEDPRAKHFYSIAKELSKKNKNTEYIDILEEINREMKKYSKYGLNANVDLYMGLIYHLLDIPKDLLGPIFVISRISGWIAQIIEQSKNNILIRPSLFYNGNINLLYKNLYNR